MDWFKVAVHRAPITVDDFSTSIVLPDPLSNSLWFYSHHGRLVQVREEGDDVAVTIVDAGYRTRYLLSSLVKLAAVVIGGWSEDPAVSPNTKDLQSVALQVRGEQLPVNLTPATGGPVVGQVGAIPPTGKPALKFLLRIESVGQVLFVELTWTNQLAVSFALTQTIRNQTAYFLTPRGYCRVRYPSGRPRVLTPFGTEVIIEPVNHKSYHTYRVNQYGLFHDAGHFFVSWDRRLTGDVPRGRTRLSDRYLLTLRSQPKDTVDIFDLTTGEVRPVRVNFSLVDYPIAYDHATRSLVLVAIDGLVVQRLAPDTPLIHLSPILTPSVEQGDQKLVEQRAVETLTELERDPAFLQRVNDRFGGAFVAPRLLTYDIIRAVLADEGFPRLVVSYQWLPELHLIVAVFRVNGRLIPKAFQVRFADRD